MDKNSEKSYEEQTREVCEKVEIGYKKEAQFRQQQKELNQYASLDRTNDSISKTVIHSIVAISLSMFFVMIMAMAFITNN